MCGRFSMALRPSQVRQELERELNMPVDDEIPAEDGPGAPRQTYNFAPGYYGVVYRADFNVQPQEPTSSHDDGSHDSHHDYDGTPSLQSLHCRANDSPTGVTGMQSRLNSAKSTSTRPGYKLQSMQWGVIPSWTKQKPDFGSMMKTINCRDDSLASPGGLWASIKGRKRCVVLAQGFYEWLQKGPKEKVPHFVKRPDGKLLCMAGLWDAVKYEGETTTHFTFTIITTSSNKQLKFLHDRMPVILEPGSEEMRVWLDPTRSEWSSELQALLKPYKDELHVYPVSKDVGKVGNNSPSYIIPVDSKENKNNIANFFDRQKKQSLHKSQEEGDNKSKSYDDAGDVNHDLQDESPTMHKNPEDVSHCKQSCLPLEVPLDQLQTTDHKVTAAYGDCNVHEINGTFTTGIAVGTKRPASHSPPHDQVNKKAAIGSKSDHASPDKISIPVTTGNKADKPPKKGTPKTAKITDYFKNC